MIMKNAQFHPINLAPAMELSSVRSDYQWKYENISGCDTLFTEILRQFHIWFSGFGYSRFKRLLGTGTR